MPINLHLISDFNIELLKRNIDSRNNKDINNIITYPYGQLYQSIYSFKKEPNNISFVWTLPESHLKSFQRALYCEDIDKEQIISEVDIFSNLIKVLSEKCRFVIIPTWQKLPHYKTYGITDWKNKLGISRLIAQMNLRLCEQFENISNIYLIDSSEWQLNQNDHINSKMWYLTKVPFENNIFSYVGNTIISSINSLIQTSKKLIVLDLDNTIWGGLIGEKSFDGINIGGHNYIGEAYKDFQKSLLALSNNGILLAVASKNDENIAIKAFDNPEMILKKENFVAMEINWKDKASNIIKISSDLNLSLDSIVFIDDNPVEREQVKILLPEVYVPNWSIDPTLYVSKLNNMRCFDQVYLSMDDKKRNKSYQENKLRELTKTKLLNEDDWLNELDTRIKIDNLNNFNIKRVAQLFNKTNQFNLSTRRLSEEEINSYYSLSENQIITISVMDKFGDLGLVGLIGTSVSSNKTIFVKDLILSCRAMGRGIEETMLYLIAKNAKDNFASGFKIKYEKTNRNNPILIFLKKAKLFTKDNILFCSEDLNNYSLPASVRLI